MKKARTIGTVVETELGLFCLMPEDGVGTYVLLEHPETLVSEVKGAVRAMPRFGKALVVGAHIGTIAVPLSTHCSELVAVEPNPRAFELLTVNAALNGGSNMTLVNVAANNMISELKFVVNYQNSGSSKRMPLYPDAEWFDSKHEIIRVPSAPLDEVLLDHEFDLIFMDCEGSEYFAFLGMQRLLKAAYTLIVEFIPGHVTRVAGVTMADWVEPLVENFGCLHVPSTGRVVGAGDFESVLSDMATKGQSDSGLVFRKA